MRLNIYCYALFLILVLVGSYTLSTKNTTNVSSHKQLSESVQQLHKSSRQLFDEIHNFNNEVIHQQSQQELQNKDQYQKLYEYALSDWRIKTVLESGNQLTTEQFYKIINYMINNTYFQNQLIQQFLIKSENKWLQGLSREAQIRYLKIVATLSSNVIDETNKMEEAKKKIKADEELGDAFTKFMNENPQMDPLQVSKQILESNYL